MTGDLPVDWETVTIGGQRTRPGYVMGHGNELPSICVLSDHVDGVLPTRRDANPEQPSVEQSVMARYHLDGPASR
jgi:hypothetical protein